MASRETPLARRARLEDDLLAVRNDHRELAHAYFRDVYAKERLLAATIEDAVREAALEAASNGSVSTTVLLKLPMWSSRLPAAWLRNSGWIEPPGLEAPSVEGIDGLPDWCQVEMAALVLEYVKGCAEGAGLGLVVPDGETVSDFPEQGGKLDWVRELSGAAAPSSSRQMKPTWMKFAYTPQDRRGWKGAPVFNECEHPHPTTELPDSRGGIVITSDRGKRSYDRSYYALKLPLYWGNRKTTGVLDQDRSG